MLLPHPDRVGNGGGEGEEPAHPGEEAGGGRDHEGGNGVRLSLAHHHLVHTEFDWY